MPAATGEAVVSPVASVSVGVHSVLLFPSNYQGRGGSPVARRGRPLAPLVTASHVTRLLGGE